MSTVNGEVKKVCQFLSTFLARSQNDLNFGEMKYMLHQLLNNLIDFNNFVNLYPVKLPKQCLEVIEKHLYLLRQQYSQGVLKIDFLNDLKDMQIKPVEEKQKLIQINESPHIKVINSSNQIKKVILKSVYSTPVMKPRTVVNFGSDKKPILTISGNQTPVQRKPSIQIQNMSTPVSVIPVKLPAIQTGNNKQECSNLQNLPVKMKIEHVSPFIPAKKKKIDISNQSGGHSELKVLPSIQAYDIKENNRVKEPIETDGNCANGNEKESVKAEATTTSCEERIEFAVKEMIEKFVNLDNVDYENIVPYMQKGLDMFAEILLVHAAYYTFHRENCRNSFKPDSALYKRIDNTRESLHRLESYGQHSLSNIERQQKAKEYQEKGILEERKRQKEEMRNYLANTQVQKSNAVISSALSNTRKILPAQTVPTIRIKKRITVKDFLPVLRQRISLTRFKTYDTVLDAMTN